MLFVWSGRYQGYYGLEIYLMDLANNRTKKLTDMRTFIMEPSFSFDGTRVVFLVKRFLGPKRKSEHELWLINADGSGLRKLKIDLRRQRMD